MNRLRAILEQAGNTLSNTHDIVGDGIDHAMKKVHSDFKTISHFVLEENDDLFFFIQEMAITENDTIETMRHKMNKNRDGSPVYAILRLEHLIFGGASPEEVIFEHIQKYRLWKKID